MMSNVIEQYSDSAPNADPESVSPLSEAQLCWILDQVDNPIALFNSSHQLVLFNHPLAELWQLPSTQLHGHPLWEQLLSELATWHPWARTNHSTLQRLLEQPAASCLVLVDDLGGSCLQLQVTPTVEGGFLLLFRHNSAAIPAVVSAPSSNVSASNPSTPAKSSSQTAFLTRTAMQSTLNPEMDWFTFLLELTGRLPTEDLIEVGRLALGYLVRKTDAAFGDIKLILGKDSVIFDTQGCLTEYQAVGRDITARKQAEEAVRHSEELYRTLAEHFPNGAVLLFNRDLHFTLANGKWLKDVGLSREMLEGKTLWEVASPDLCTLAEPHLRSVLAGESVTLEAPYSDRTFQITLLPCQNDTGAIFAGMLVAQDITAHKQSEKLLRQKNEQLGSQVEEQMAELRRTIEQLHQEVHQRQLVQKQLQDALQRLNFHVENSPLAVIEWDIDFRITRWSREAEDLFGWRSEEVLGKFPYDHWKFIHEQDWQTIDQAIADLFSGRQQRNSFYHRNYTRTGAIVHCESYNSVLFDAVGNVVSILSLVLNVTERKLAEEEVERQSLRLRLLADTTLKIRQSLHLEEILQTTVTEVRELLLADRVLIYRLLPDGNGKVITEARIPGLTSILGKIYSSEVFPKDCHDLYSQGKTRSIENVETAQLTPCHQQFLQQLGVKAKLVVPLMQSTELWGLMIVHQCELPRQWSVFEVELLQQLADQVSIALGQAQLLERLRLLESVVVNANDSVVITEAESLTILGPRILYANAAFTRMTGYQLEDVVGKTPRILQGAKTDRQVLAKLRQNLEQWQPSVVELLNYRKDGSEFWVEMSTMPVANETGWYTHWVAIQRDITHRKQLEAELLNTLEKEKELSELKSRFVSMTSHEFRTPLSTILSASELLEYYGNQWTEEERLEQLHLIQQAVQHMTQLLEDILIIGRAEANRLEFQPGLVEMTHFCRTLVAQVQVSIGKQHILSYTSHCPLLTAQMDEKLLRQILTNLLSNAVKYSPPHSTIQFELSCDNRMVILQVQDQGIGIPPEDLPRLFDSFHRAKNVGTIPGTGLGLAIVKHCVDVHGGSITVDSKVGEGTRFRVALPMGASS
jgi:PAS domain S-box-containing protein